MGVLLVRSAVWPDAPVGRSRRRVLDMVVEILTNFQGVTICEPKSTPTVLFGPQKFSAHCWGDGGRSHRTVPGQENRRAGARSHRTVPEAAGSRSAASTTDRGPHSR